MVSNLQFTGDSNGTYTRGVGYTAQCVFTFLGDMYSEVVAAGSQVTTHALTSDEFSTRMLSASYNTQTNMFTITNHKNADNNVFLYSDSGLSTMPAIAWETHDAGDKSPNADTNSFAATGQVTWVSKEEAASLLNHNATEYTPANFDEIYEKVWNKHHAYAMALQQPTSITAEGDSNKEEDKEASNLDGSDDSDTKEEDDDSTSNGQRRLFVAITSMVLALLGSSV